MQRQLRFVPSPVLAHWLSLDRADGRLSPRLFAPVAAAGLNERAIRSNHSLGLLIPVTGQIAPCSAGNDSLFLIGKFPVPVRREFGHKSLPFLAILVTEHNSNTRS